MALRDPIGVWFSFLEDNWEECEFYYDFSLKKTTGIMQHTVITEIYRMAVTMVFSFFQDHRRETILRLRLFRL